MMEHRIGSQGGFSTLTGVQDFHKWKLAVENSLLINGCLGILDGTDQEPYRQLMVDGTTVSIP